MALGPYCGKAVPQYLEPAVDYCVDCIGADLKARAEIENVRNRMRDDERKMWDYLAIDPFQQKLASINSTTYQQLVESARVLAEGLGLTPPKKVQAAPEPESLDNIRPISFED